MDKEAFKRSLKGTLRHLKRKFKTMDPVKKWTGIGAGIGGGIGAGFQHISNKATDKFGTKEGKKFKEKHPILHHPLTMGAAMAGYGAVKFRDIGHSEKAFRQHLKTMRRAYRGAYRGAGGSGGGRSREAGKATPPPKAAAPEWLKGVKTKADAKAKHRAEAMKHHPDRGGSEDKMKKVNAEWDAFKAHHFGKLSHVLPAFWAELELLRETSR